MAKYKETIRSKKKDAGLLLSDEQLKKCSMIIHGASLACSAAGAIPIPIADAIPISAGQISMVIALGKVFHRDISSSAANAIIAACASSLVGRSFVKMIPVVGWGISAAVAAGITEALGWTVTVDFAKQEKNPEIIVEFEEIEDDNTPC